MQRAAAKCRNQASVQTSGTAGRNTDRLVNMLLSTHTRHAVRAVFLLQYRTAHKESLVRGSRLRVSQDRSAAYGSDPSAGDSRCRLDPRVLQRAVKGCAGGRRT